MADFSLLDRDDIRGRMFYPRPDRTLPPSGAHDLSVAVADDVQMHVRIYGGVPERPTILFFHGNGEVVADYDPISRLYAQAGLNLAVGEYRGYGASGGSPAYTAMMADAHAIKRAVLAERDRMGWTHGRYVMGRSLGAMSALELAATDDAGLRGVILESGAASPSGWPRFAGSGDGAAWAGLADVQRERFAAMRLPLLMIHGADDELIPLERAREAYRAAGSTSKQLVVVPDAGHNDLLFVGLRPYFEALTAFVAECEGKPAA